VGYLDKDPAGATEYLGMLNVPVYGETWEKKLAWYKASDFLEQLITSQDAPNGGTDAGEIERLARARIPNK
jgi:exodeoxyribonuclease V alpha subunit